MFANQDKTSEIIPDMSIISLDSPTPPSSPVNNLSNAYIDTPPSHLSKSKEIVGVIVACMYELNYFFQITFTVNTNSGVSSTTHNNWTNPTINSLTNNHNLLPR